MRLLWIFIFTLAFILAFVFQDVNAVEHHKKGSGHKGMINHNDEAPQHHLDVGRAGSVPKGPGDHKLPSGDRSSPHKSGRDHSSSSGKHSDKSSRRDQKHKDKKHGKDKHNKHSGGKKKDHRSGKNHPE